MWHCSTVGFCWPTRNIYQLRSTVHPGNSGGRTLLTADGRVHGMAFARSTSHPDTGYAPAANQLPARHRPAGRAGRQAARDTANGRMTSRRAPYAPAPIT